MHISNDNLISQVILNNDLIKVDLPRFASSSSFESNYFVKHIKQYNIKMHTLAQSMWQF